MEGVFDDRTRDYVTYKIIMFEAQGAWFEFSLTQSVARRPAVMAQEDIGKENSGGEEPGNPFKVALPPTNIGSGVLLRGLPKLSAPLGDESFFRVEGADGVVVVVELQCPGLHFFV